MSHSNQVELLGIRKKYGTSEVIRGVDLNVGRGEFVVFVGPSGCGKSTLLRMIAGLEEISDGDLRIEGRSVKNLPPAKRGISMVFQSYALYPHLSVEDNMGFGLKQAKTDKAVIKNKVAEAARMLQLEELLTRRPRQLSGGQRQRVAIGRAIVRDPTVFLFDEPLSNLDAALRVQMRLEIARLHKEMNATMIYVTHDQTEAMTLADRIVVLNQGRIEQVGTPLELYTAPLTKFVAGFIGSPRMNFLPALITRSDDATAIVELPNGTRLKAPRLSIPRDTEQRIILGVRPHEITLPDRSESIATDITLGGRIEVIENLGNSTLLHIRTGGDTLLTVERSGIALHRADEIINVGIDLAHCHCFDGNGKRLTLL
ncbi:ABC transporter ATP-binding protein [Salinicola peritrichatus]|uniref:ABC transporter ATP-binding protein n=1 Tax=Salinicola peritrichatus TaxID=1267424 RepID=UPI000DA1409B|nr:sn-glycerol-3-phosphate ABC transporter ATP-binding protein UgpC [Salinicola peritrichatus]